MSAEPQEEGWNIITVDDAITGTTYEVSYQPESGRYRVNGIDVQRMDMLEKEDEVAQDIYTYRGEGIVANLSLTDLQRLLD